MDYYGLLFLYYLKGLSGKSILRLFFNIEAGGTEEILPSALLNGVVDLGTLNWYYSSGANPYFTVDFTTKTNSDGICEPYEVIPNTAVASSPDKTIQLRGSTLIIVDSSYTNATDLKNSLNGVLLYYQKSDSTPATSPILADIQYPDGLRTGQYFTYRETPTTVSNKARIKTIKGNTLNWNQLVQNGNFADTNGWSATRGTITTSNNILSYTSTAIGGGATQNRLEHNLPVILANHKIFVRMRVKPAHATRCVIQVAVNGAKVSVGQISVNGNVWNDISLLYTLPYALDSGSNLWFGCEETSSNGYVIGDVDQYMNVIISDLTQMGLDISSPSEFTSLFSLPYYEYNQGTLLSFNGTGIKTVGFNQWDEEWESGTIANDGSKVAQVSRIRSKNYIPVLPNTTYYTQINNYSIPSYACLRYAYDADKNPIGVIGSNYSVSFTTPSNCYYILFSPNAQYGTTYKNDICINISDTERNGTYEPYTSSTLSLPISTYFPNGMKSAGNVYDELTESKAITRIGSVDLGTLNWSYVANDRRFIAIISDAKSSSSLTVLENIVSAKYENATWENILTQAKDKIIALHYTSNNSYVAVIDNDYTDATAFKTAMSGVYLYYELAEYQETPITTEDANEALSLLMGKTVSSSNANQLIDIITKGE